MAARKNYPTPECPKCGKSGAGANRVRNTYYTEHKELVRTRECNSCGWKWWTVQAPEENLLPDRYRIHIPRWGDQKEKTITITPIPANVESFR